MSRESHHPGPDYRNNSLGKQIRLMTFMESVRATSGFLLSQNPSSTHQLRAKMPKVLVLTLRSEDAGARKGGKKTLISEGMGSVAEEDDSLLSLQFSAWAPMRCACISPEFVTMVS